MVGFPKIGRVTRGVLRSRVILGLAFLALSGGSVTGAPPAGKDVPLVIVDQGQPCAEIVVPEDRPRMVTLAALELQRALRKMSGACLPIVTIPSKEKRVHIHIGQSPATERLGFTSDGLRNGAYRIVSGPDWLVLIGRDSDFDFSKLPWPLKRKEGPEKAAAWAKAIQGKTATAWSFPFNSGFRGFWAPDHFQELMSQYFGEDFRALWKTKPGMAAGFWKQDVGGSLNAVYGFLRSLGVRWYMPGDLGEIIPRKTNLAVGPFHETVIPDFPLRDWMWYGYNNFGFEGVIWARRLGMNSSHELLGTQPGPHGLVHVHGHLAMKKTHPEYYALIGGKRDTEHRSYGTPCFSSRGLEQETVNFIRFMYDELGLPSVDLWPVDGLRLCQCDDCKGKLASDLVWGFADRVARKVYETHPDKRITCGAYTSYRDPPGSIKKLSPNLAVWIANAGRPLLADPERWGAYVQLVEGWRNKVKPGNILRLENNRYHIWAKDEPIVYPVIHPRSMAKDLKFLKGISQGDTGEQSQEGGKWRAPGLEHITLFVQASFLWNAEQDVDRLLDEYCTLFYGPAAGHMMQAITFAEQNLAFKDQSRTGGRADPRNVPIAANVRLRELLEAARQAAGDTIHGKRIQLILSELQPKEEMIASLRAKEKALEMARSNAPGAVGMLGRNLEKARVYYLKDNMNGMKPGVATSFRVAWDDHALLFDILCMEPEIKKLRVNKDVLEGDAVAISLDTRYRSYYHIEINPEGVVLEGNPGPNWKSLAEVKTERGSDFWRVRVRIPVVSVDEAHSDPKHRVGGRKPTAREPWYFNVGRARYIDLAKPELQAFSPTHRGWHEPSKFGKLWFD